MDCLRVAVALSLRGTAAERLAPTITALMLSGMAEKEEFLRMADRKQPFIYK